MIHFNQRSVPRSPTPIERLYAIESTFFFVGIVTRDNVVVRAGNIVRYMIGWTIFRVETYAEHRDWKLTEIKGA